MLKMMMIGVVLLCVSCGSGSDNNVSERDVDRDGSRTTLSGDSDSSAERRVTGGSRESEEGNDRESLAQSGERGGYRRIADFSLTNGVLESFRKSRQDQSFQNEVTETPKMATNQSEGIPITESQDNTVITSSKDADKAASIHAQKTNIVNNNQIVLRKKPYRSGAEIDLDEANLDLITHEAQTVSADKKSEKKDTVRLDNKTNLTRDVNKNQATGATNQSQRESLYDDTLEKRGKSDIPDTALEKQVDKTDKDSEGNNNSIKNGEETALFNNNINLSNSQDYNEVLSVDNLRDKTVPDIMIENNQDNDAVRDEKLSQNYYAMGNTNYNMGNYTRAIEYYSRAIEKNPIFAAAFNNRGNAYYQTRQFDQSISDYNEVIRLAPRYAKAYNNRGIAYYAKGDFNRAIGSLEKAIQLLPQYAKAYNNLGAAYAGKRDYKKAVENYNTAIVMQADYALAYNNRGFTRFELGEYGKAISDFQRALQYDPSLAESHLGLGISYLRSGNPSRARDSFKRAISLDERYNHSVAEILEYGFFYSENQIKAIQELKDML